jgi:hypothetical protein
MRVRRGLVMTNYAMIKAKPSSFDLKTMSVRGHSSKLLLLRSDFFPHLGDRK